MIIRNTKGIGETMTRNATPADILHHYRLAVTQGCVGISLHSQKYDLYGTFVTSEEEANELTARLLAMEPKIASRQEIIALAKKFKQEGDSTSLALAKAKAQLGVQ
jgi:hypothetical protein